MPRTQSGVLALRPLLLPRPASPYDKPSTALSVVCVVVDTANLSIHHQVKSVIGFSYLRENKRPFCGANGQKFGLGHSIISVQCSEFLPFVQVTQQPVRDAAMQ